MHKGPRHAHWHLSWVTWTTQTCGGGNFHVPRDQLCYSIDVLSSLNRRLIVTVAFSLTFIFFYSLFYFPPSSKGQGPGPGAFSLSHHGGCIARNNTVLRRNSEYLPFLGLNCICDLRCLLY